MHHEITLINGPVTLRPLRVDDGSALRAVVDEDSWAGMSSPLPATDTAMMQHVAELIAKPNNVPFAVELDGRFVGRTLFYDLVPQVRVDIGSTIYAREVWGSVVNPAAKLLLIGYAFEELRVQRVALRCDSRNTRSHHAIRRLGAHFEGTLRHFRLAADGSIADIDYFSITPAEKDQVLAGLRARLT